MSLLHLAKLFLLVYSWNFSYFQTEHINAHTLFLNHAAEAVTALSEHKAGLLASRVTLD